MSIDLSTPPRRKVWRQDLYNYLWMSRSPICDCGCQERLHSKFDLHEGIVTRRDVQGWRYPEKAWIFSELNCVWLLHDHHLNHPPPREAVWHLQCGRYGVGAMEDWYYSLPFKVFPRRF